MSYRTKRFAMTACALALGAGLSACGTVNSGPQNHTLYSVNQPVVERQNFALDLAANGGGVSVPEQARLADWFETLDLRYGDRVSIDDPANSRAVTEDVAAVASRFGILLSEGAPITEGFVNPGNVRIVVTRSHAHVPGCPNWGNQYGFNQGNQTSPNYGCATNSNIAAMVADPEHLLEGASGTGDTVIQTSNRAINAFREAAPSGAGGASLPQPETGGN